MTHSSILHDDVCQKLNMPAIYYSQLLLVSCMVSCG